MKLSDIVYASFEEVKAMPRFNLSELPRKAKWYLQPVAWLASFPETFATHTKIKKINMKGLKPPYILLCNHNRFFDFKMATRAIFPHPANWIVAVDGFINRENIMRNVGCFGKRKFISDIRLVQMIKASLFKNNYICAIYPEARYSLCGTTAILPDSLGKMVKLFKVPVVTLIGHGHHLRQPVWNTKKRKIRTLAVMTHIMNKEDIEKLSVDEINQMIEKNFQYDDFAYQRDNNLHIKDKNRAVGLHKILYKCPACGDETSMRSAGDKLWCDHCHKTYTMDTLSRLEATEGETEFSHIPDWFEWERSEVRKEVESGNYRLETVVDIDSLPNSMGYYRLGSGKMIHDINGFHMETILEDGTPFVINKKALENYGVHIEYDYHGKGDHFSFSELDDTYCFFSRDKDFHITKISFGVEEVYKKVSEKRNQLDFTQVFRLGEKYIKLSLI
jgi:ribosomal protein L37AE/L43A